ncbi:MAG: ATP-dependent DNA ligase [Deltaproteobacteria bacterium]|nr:ATP-dependent DNA ligase [Deltaproteobacteria bacterium]
MKRFAEISEAIGATTKKLEKVGLLGSYLATLGDEELRAACTFLTGRPFPLSEMRTLNVGGALIVRAVLALAGVEEERLWEAYRRWGDLGGAAEELLAGRTAPEGLTLRQVRGAFEELAALQGEKRKLGRLIALLRALAPGEGKFAVKVMTSDLRIGLKEELVEEAIARAFGAPQGEVEWANMLLGDIGETAVRARQGRLHAVELRLFHPLKFMLASPAPSGAQALADMGGTAIVEDKYDGIRAQVHTRGGEHRIFSRTLDEVTHRFPELSPVAGLGHDVILDGELVAYRAGRALPFAKLQARLGRKAVSPGLLGEVPVVFFAFDLLYLDGELLLREPLRVRKARLAGLTLPAPARLAASDEIQEPERLEALFEACRARGNEGLMLKAPGSVYHPGKRGMGWLKMKRPLATLDVVVTAVEYGHGKRRGVLSDYTFAVRNGERLVNIGKAYSGLTDREIQQLTAYFLSHTIEDQGWRKVVEPTVVLEVAFDAVQRSGRHESGYALRFPRILRVREDKGAEEIDDVETVGRMIDAGRRG